MYAAPGCCTDVVFPFKKLQTTSDFGDFTLKPHHELQPVRWQESARLFWIITPDWFHLAPALLIWQSCSPPRTLALRQREKTSESFFNVYWSVFLSFFALCVSECPSTSLHALFIQSPGPNPRLCVAVVPPGIWFTASGWTLSLSHILLEY